MSCDDTSGQPPPCDRSFLRQARIIVGVCRLIANHLHLAIFESMPKVRALCSAGITRPRRSYGPVRHPSWPSPASDVEAATLAQDGSQPVTQLGRSPASGSIDNYLGGLFLHR